MLLPLLKKKAVKMKNFCLNKTYTILLTTKLRGIGNLDLGNCTFLKESLSIFNMLMSNRLQKAQI